MVVPLPCGKLQSCRGLGVKIRAAGGAAAPRVVKPRAAPRLALLVCAAGLAAGAQESTRAPDDLVVSSRLERIVAAPVGNGAAAVQVSADTVASHADQLIVSVRFTNAS